MAQDLPAHLTDAVRDLLRRHPDTVSLDAIADAIGDRAVTPPQIDEMMRRLEAEGRHVEPPDPLDLPALLRRVLGAARELQSRGTAPTTTQIAARLDIPIRRVHAALLFSRTLTG